MSDQNLSNLERERTALEMKGTRVPSTQKKSSSALWQLRENTHHYSLLAKWLWLRMKGRRHDRSRDSITNQENSVGTKARGYFFGGVGRGWQREETWTLEKERLKIQSRRWPLSFRSSLLSSVRGKTAGFPSKRRGQNGHSVTDSTQQRVKDSKRGQRGRTHTISYGHFQAFQSRTIPCNFMSALFRLCFSSWSFSGF